MIKRLIAISGNVSSGKSTLAKGLSKNFGFNIQKTKDWLLKRYKLKKKPDRKDLQDIGDRLDKRYGGKWILTELMNIITQIDNTTIIVDSIRTKQQIEELRKAFGTRVSHIHLTAPDSELEHRLKKRKRKDMDELSSYRNVKQNITEKNIDSLKDIADIVIDTNRCTAEDVLIRASSHLKLCPTNSTGYVDILIGGQYGSEGKGQIAHYISREYDLLIRVGGPNAGHRVFEIPEPFTHHLLPSGTRNSNAQLLLGPGTTINLKGLLDEISKCNVDNKRLSIDRKATIILPRDIEDEEGIKTSIGSTKQGVGAATARRILNRKTPGAPLARDIPELQPYLCDSIDVLEKAFIQNQRMLLEGTQGTGLSLYHGEYPYVTSRDTTVNGCLAEIGIPPSKIRKIIMVCRTYPIRVGNPRHGFSGPMSQKVTMQEIANRSGKRLNEIKRIEITSTTHRRRKIGEFDWVLLRKAARLNGPTDIALTFSDYISKKNEKAKRFEQLTPETISFIHEIERVSGARVSLITTGFNSRSVIDRRAWG